jgi:hypothetical protein
MTLAIDGVPFRGAERMKHRFMTRLTADIGPEPTQLPVEDASGFPNSGTVLIDDELIDYSGRSQTGLRAFRRAARHTWVENESNQGTSWRGTAHKAGAAVELYGYANPLASDLPAGGGRTLPGAQGSWGEFSVAYPVAEDRFPVNVGNVPVLVEGLAANRTTLRIDANLLDGGGVAGFPSSGYALLVSRELRIPGATPQAPPLASFGGAELIAYDGISGGALTGVRRGASTRRLEGSGLDLRAKDHVRFVSAPGTPRYELPFAVVPVSAGAAAGGDWLDPMVTGFSERIQVEREWIRYDELIAGAAGGAMHFVRSDPTVFARVYGHVNGLRWYPAGGAPGGSGLAVPPQQPAPPPRQPGPNPIPVPEGGEWTHATLRNQLAGLVHYRGVDDTQVPNVGVAHAGGTEIVPVFRTEGYSAAAGDVVTVISGDGRFRERRRVQWAAREVTPLVQAEVPPRIVNRGGETRVALVALNGNVSRRIVSDVARMRAQDENVHLPSALGFDTRGVARILKAPSGEMPYTMEMQLTVGGTFGGRHTPCWVDEVGVAQTNLAQVWHRVVSPRQERPVPADAKELTLRRDSLWNGWGSEASQWRRREVPPAPGAPPPPPGGRPVLTRVLFETSKMRAADRGRPLVNLVKRANEPWVRARAIPGRSFASRPAGDDRDCGVIQVGTELIAYRGFEDRPAENLIVLKDLARGFFGTEAAPHYDGEEATFQAWMDLALLKGAVDGGAFAIPVENTFGFPPQGMLALLDARGQAAEVVSWTRIGGEGFEMPRGAGTGESDAAERGLFRGRFGTAPVAHEPGTIAYEMPFRYWDRAVEGADDPNLGYYQFPVEVGEAWFRSLTWSAKLLQPHLRLRVLARVDARSPWGAQPDGARGLFEFRQPRDEEHPNRIEMQGDLLEARVYFEYEPGAFRPDFTSDAWKETPVLESIAVDYYAPNRVLSSVK